MIKGIDVTLVQRVPGTTEDDFGRPIMTETETTVSNVLVAPSSSQDIINELSISGRRIVYNLAIPKGDANTWEGGLVRFFGRTFRVVGAPVEGIEDLIPLEWNKKVSVEVYE